MVDQLDISEKDFEGQVKDLAKVFGWKYYHTWRSMHSPVGFPDCVLVKPPRLVFAELKSRKGKPTPEQEEWLKLLSQVPFVEAYLWYPHEIEEVAEVLGDDQRGSVCQK